MIHKFHQNFKYNYFFLSPVPSIIYLFIYLFSWTSVWMLIMIALNCEQLGVLCSFYKLLTSTTWFLSFCLVAIYARLYLRWIIRIRSGFFCILLILESFSLFWDMLCLSILSHIFSHFYDHFWILTTTTIWRIMVNVKPTDDLLPFSCRKNSK